MKEKSPDIWWYEDQTPNRRLSLRAKRVLCDQETEFQRLSVLEVYDQGHTLVLDGCLQLTETDEFMYHEMLAHPSLFSLASPLDEIRVLIIGGGDGGTAREALKHASVSQVDLVDIDPVVTEVSRQYFPKIWQRDDGTTLDDDPRLAIHHVDGIEWVGERAERPESSYDCILVDSTDPIGPGTILFSQDFYSLLGQVLSESGLIAVQAGSPIYQPEVTQMALTGLRAALGEATLYLGIAPSYPSGLWCYAAASKSRALRPEFPVDGPARYEEMVAKHGPLGYYSPSVHSAAFVLPPFVEKLSKGQ